MQTLRGRRRTQLQWGSTPSLTKIAGRPSTRAPYCPAFASCLQGCVHGCKDIHDHSQCCMQPQQHHTFMYCCRTLTAPGTSTSRNCADCCEFKWLPSNWYTGVIRSVLAWLSCSSFCSRVDGCLTSVLACRRLATVLPSLVGPCCRRC